MLFEFDLIILALSSQVYRQVTERASDAHMREIWTEGNYAGIGSEEESCGETWEWSQGAEYIP